VFPELLTFEEELRVVVLLIDLGLVVLNLEEFLMLVALVSLPDLVVAEDLPLSPLFLP
jgi:hypothetical protein